MVVEYGEKKLVNNLSENKENTAISEDSESRC
jgi:hypothetical protein